MAFCKPVVLKSIENLRGKLFNKVAKVLEVLGFVFVNTDECSWEIDNENLEQLVRIINGFLVVSIIQ